MQNCILNVVVACLNGVIGDSEMPPPEEFFADDFAVGEPGRVDAPDDGDGNPVAFKDRLGTLSPFGKD